MRGLWCSSLLGSLLFLVACGSEEKPPEAECTGPGGQGTIQFVVNGLPRSPDREDHGEEPSLDPSPRGDRRAELAQETVTILADTVAPSALLFRTAYRAEGSPSSLCVRGGERATVTVNYTPIPSSGKLWTSNGSGGTAPLLGFSANVLGSSGSPAATGRGHHRGLGGLRVRQGGQPVGGRRHDRGSAGAPDPRGLAGQLGPEDRGHHLEGRPPRGRLPPRPRAGLRRERQPLGLRGLQRQDRPLHPGPAHHQRQPHAWRRVHRAQRALGAGVRRGGQPVGRLLWRRTGWPATTRAASRLRPPRLRTSSSRRWTPGPVFANLRAPTGLGFDVDGNLWVNFSGTFARLTRTDQQGSGEVVLTPAVQIGLTVTALPEGLVFDEGRGMWFALRAGEFGPLDPGQLTELRRQDPHDGHHQLRRRLCRLVLLLSRPRRPAAVPPAPALSAPRKRLFITMWA